jgi:hypothetical protein
LDLVAERGALGGAAEIALRAAVAHARGARVAERERSIAERESSVTSQQRHESAPGEVGYLLLA